MTILLNPTPTLTLTLTLLLLLTRTMRRHAEMTQAVSKAAVETERPDAAGVATSAPPSFHPSANPYGNPSTHPASL